MFIIVPYPTAYPWHHYCFLSMDIIFLLQNIYPLYLTQHRQKIKFLFFTLTFSIFKLKSHLKLPLAITVFHSIPFLFPFIIKIARKKIELFISFHTISSKTVLFLLWMINYPKSAFFLLVALISGKQQTVMRRRKEKKVLEKGRALWAQFHDVRMKTLLLLLGRGIWWNFFPRC